MQPNNDLFARADVPLCFDTSAIHGNVAGANLLHAIRKQFPAREPIVPAWVVAEKVRQMRLDMGEAFNMAKVRGFLSDPDLKLEVKPFNRNTAIGSWQELVGPFSNEEWRWEHLPAEYVPRPCAERCRTGDHIVYAIARAHGALLVTDDRGLVAQVQTDAYRPGVVMVQAVQSMLDA